MLRRYLLGSASLAGLVIGLPVLAQTPPPAQQPAAPAAASGAGLEEVVVTAQKRSEKLKDVPLTVNAINGNTLEKQGVTNILELQHLVPGLHIGNQVGFETVHLRGVGSGAIGPGIETPVGIYVDGVYIASSSASFLDFLNVDNVQVLKGPQGTLFGRNATGGLIQITTKEPTQETTLDADIGYGSYETAKGDFYLSTGITDTLAADIAIQLGEMGEGYGKNLASGEDVYRNNGSLALRSKWVWKPSDDFKLTLAVDFERQRNSLDTLNGPPGTANLPLIGFKPTTHTSNPWDVSVDDAPLDQNNTGGFSLKTEHDFGFADVTNIAAYRQTASAYDFDLDNTDEPFQAAYLRSDENQFSDELQFASKADSTIKWTTGLYYFHSYSSYDPSYVYFDPTPGLNLLHIGATPGSVLPDIIEALAVYSKQTADSFAGYAQATAAVLPDTNVTFGIRYTYEEHTLEGDQPFYIGRGPNVLFSATLPPTSKHFESPSVRLALDHHFDDNLMAYVSYNTGFKSGGFNTQSVSPPDVFQPEKLTAYEIGLKGEYLEHKLRFDLAAFHYDYKDIQVQKVVLASTNIINGAQAGINGVDFDFNAKITPQFTINGNAEYLNASFGSFEGAPTDTNVLDGFIYAFPAGTACVPVATCHLLTTVPGGSATGHQLPYSPHFSFTVAADYTIDLADSTLLFDFTVNHSGYFTEPDNVQRQSPFTKLDTSLRWEPNNGHYGVLLWAKNLTNEATFSNMSTLGNGLHQSTLEAPLTFGVLFQYHLNGAPESHDDAAVPMPPPAAPAPAPVAATPEAARQFQVFFDFDKSDITSAAAKVIQAASDAVKAGNVVKVVVTGHTDTVGSASYNQGLSERRATAVKSAMVADGVSGGEISTVGVGKTGLLAPTDGVREPQNRRAEIVLQ